MNSFSFTGTKESFSSSQSLKRNKEREGENTETKRPKIFQFDSFISNIFPSMFSKLKVNQNVVDISDSDEESASNIETDKENPLVMCYERISIYQSDLSCLKEYIFLNDKIIDFMLSKLRNKYEMNCVHLFNSMFYVKLDNILNSENYYTAISRWFKSGDSANKNIWIIPVCDKLHWYIVAIVYPVTNRPQIFVMDSQRRDDYNSVNKIKIFLQQKFKAENQKDISVIETYIVNVPQQVNAYDCGLYALRSAEILMTEYSSSYILYISTGQHNEKAGLITSFTITIEPLDFTFLFFQTYTS